MSRFQNLEFNEGSGEEFESRPVVKDEAYYFSAATSAFENGNFEQALRHYSKVLEYNPENASAWTGQVRMLIELNELREAKLWADKALEHFPKEAELLAAKAVALGRLGDSENAMAFSDAAIEERGETTYVWLARADVLMSRKMKSADFCFEKALRFAPQSWFFRWLASRIYSYYKKFSLALKYAREALAIETGRTVIWLQMGHCQLALGMTGLAQDSFEQARQLTPNCPEAEMALIRIADTGPLKKLRGMARRFLGK